MIQTSFRLIGFVFIVIVVASLGTDRLTADEPGVPSAKQATEITQRQRDLAKYLSGKKFVGQFTIDGKPGTTKVEEYQISRCEKLDAPDKYRLMARIKYGDVDNQVPLDLTILFAGKTPVITLDSFWIPGMGTFDARVLIRRDHYAGTWKHDEVGGHLFGRIVAIADEPDESSVDTDPQ